MPTSMLDIRSRRVRKMYQHVLKNFPERPVPCICWVKSKGKVFVLISVEAGHCPVFDLDFIENTLLIKLGIHFSSKGKSEISTQEAEKILQREIESSQEIYQKTHRNRIQAGLR